MITTIWAGKLVGVKVNRTLINQTSFWTDILQFFGLQGIGPVMVRSNHHFIGPLGGKERSVPVVR